MKLTCTCHYITFLLLTKCTVNLILCLMLVLYYYITGNPAPPMQAVLQPHAGTIQSRACVFLFDYVFLRL